MNITFISPFGHVQQYSPTQLRSYPGAVHYYLTLRRGVPLDVILILVYVC